MFFWIGMAIGFVVVVALIWRFARHADVVESDSSYAREEQPFTPYGQKYLDIMRGHGNDD